MRVRISVHDRTTAGLYPIVGNRRSCLMHCAWYCSAAQNVRERTYHCAGPDRTPHVWRTGVVIWKVFQHNDMEKSDEDGRLAK